MLNQIHVGDNIQTLLRLRDANLKFDLICTDPPYNVGKDFGNNTDKQTVADYLVEIGKRIELLNDLTAENGAVIWFASHLYVHHMHRMFEEAGFTYQRMMIWHYRNGMSRQKNSPVTEYEPFLWFTKTDQYTYNGDDVRVPYRSERVKSPVYKTNKNGDKVAWMPDPRGAKRGDVWEYPVLAGKLYENERTEHPSQKPISLMIDLLQAFCPKSSTTYSGKILDPYAGSGSTLVACQRLNNCGHQISFVGCELEQKWVNVANARVNSEKDKCIL